MLELLDEKLVELFQPGETVKRQHMVILPNDKEPELQNSRGRNPQDLPLRWRKCVASDGYCFEYWFFFLWSYFSLKNSEN